MDDSSKYRIFETREFLRTLEKRSEADIRLIRAKLENYVYPQLREQPFYGVNIRKLRDFRTDVWRYRIGRFRVFYTIDSVERVVSVLTVEDRKDAYR